MTNADTATRLAIAHDAATLSQAAAARIAAEVLMRTPGVVPDEALATVLASFGRLVLHAIAEVAPDRLSDASRARIAAAQQRIEICQ